tara:strand:- start:1 stop:771 length:771 start_codon:yes stop_codon:yes gene_type:complete
MSNFTHPRFFSLQDQNLNEPSQRSEEWFRRRKNKLSGSKLSNFLFCKDDEERKRWYEEVFEGREREPFTEVQLGYMEYGRENEDTAMIAFLNQKTDIMAFEAPHVQHNSVEWLSATPDGFYQIFDEEAEDLVILEEGIIEIKCPARTRKANKKVTYYYVPQMFLEMCCSDKRKAIFVSWDKTCVRAWRLEWDDDYWNILSRMMDNFHNTKNGSTYEQFKLCQFELRRASHKMVEKAVPLYPGNGWTLTPKVEPCGP